MRAVIPAAGRGTRLRPLSLAIPKELLPAGELPMIGRAVAEAVESGIRDVCVVLRKGKEAIAGFLEATAPQECRLAFRWQPEPLGMGHAVWCARDFAREEPFLVLVPDQFLVGPVSPGRQLLAQYRFTAPTVLSGWVLIPAAEVRYFPGARGVEVAREDRRTFRRGMAAEVVRLRPAPGRAGGSGARVAGFGRAVYPAEVFPFLTCAYRSRDTGEVDLWESFMALSPTLRHCALLLRGRPVDLGTLAGYRRYLPHLLRMR